jgi:tetratricopeptide (TPR) repeat protein
MKTVSKLALAAIFATGASGLALSAPAFAKDKKAEAKAPGLKLSPDVLKAGQAAQTAIAAKDFATAEPAVVQVEAAAKTDDDKYIAAAMRYDLEQQKLAVSQAANPNAPINETVLAKPLEALIASPSTPAADRGRYAYRRGALAFNGKQYPQALQYFAQAKQLDYNDPNLSLQIVKAKMESGDVAGATADLDAAIAAQSAGGQKADEQLYRYAIAKSYQAKLKPQTMTWLKKWVSAYPTSKNWRDTIVLYGVQQNALVPMDETQKIDMFRLMRATKSLADQNDYLEYADSVNRRGLPSEAQAVVKEGIATGKIPASNTLAKGLIADTTTAIRNDGPIAAIEKRAEAAPNGKLAASTGDVYLGQDNYAKAVTMYRLALTKGGVAADDVNLHLGIALAKSGDKAGASTAFGAIQSSPRKETADLWSTWMAAPVA